MSRPDPKSRRWAVTLLELLVVLVIVSILSTIATGIYTGEVRRARITAAHDQLRGLELAIARYEIDVGILPPSGSGNTLPPISLTTDNTARFDGSGYLHVALVYSMSGTQYRPASPLWKGSYINLQADQLGAPTEALSDVPGRIDILDPWGNPILYVRSDDYTLGGANFSGGTDVFSGAAPGGANPDLPAPNPFLALGETYYNPQTFQLLSFGPNESTFEPGTVNYQGAEADDITNFGY